MSSKYPGGFITKSPVAPTTTAASGVWTLDQQQQYQKAGTWPSPPIFIEDIFSTYLYTGNGSTQTITNGIDLSGQGGLVWTKARVTAGFGNELTDTVRGAGLRLISNTTGAQGGAGSSDTTGFTSSGFQLTFNNGLGNLTGENYVSWTFREQPKFFDIVTWTGDDTYGRAIPHNLGSTPGCFIIKCTSNASTDWIVYHSALGVNSNVYLNDTTSAVSGNNFYNGIAPTSTNIYVGSSTVGSNAYVNQSGRTYVAYLFAHDAGGFPASGAGSTNGISCGSFVTGSGGKMTAPVNLGYEPQWLMIKNSGASENWTIYDTMRGLSYAGYNVLYPNTSAAEYSSTTALVPTATGFDTPNASGPFATSANYIYVAIRRGPMKTPTTGTSVYTPITYNGNGTSQTITGSVGVPDLGLGIGRSGGQAGQNAWYDRLRGKELALRSTNTTAEYNASPGGEGTMTNVMNGMRVENTYGILNDGTTPYILYFLTRAPSFFDEVCWTGTNADQTLTHNLTVVPELIIYKTRATTSNWYTAYSFTSTTYGYSLLNLTNAPGAQAYSGGGPFSAQPTATQFSVGQFYNPTSAMVAYLFATCAGVSKVGSYTGTGALLTVDCGFTSGARFVLIKRTDSTGDWYTYDSARGITSGNDPYLLLNSTAAEVTGTNYVDTDTTGFKVTAAAPAGLNASGGTYIFLAIA